MQDPTMKIKCMDDSFSDENLKNGQIYYTDSKKEDRFYLIPCIHRGPWAAGRFQIIDEETPTAAKASDQGMSCSGCQNFNDYAESNQDDGTFKCFSCRNR